MTERKHKALARLGIVSNKLITYPLDHNPILMRLWSKMASRLAFAWTASIVLAFIVTLLAPARGSAQAVANAQIHGTVQDSTGNAVSGARITATQTETGHAQSTVSGADGSYLLADLPVGSYTVLVTAPSFSTYVQNGIVLQVGQNVQINIPLSLGAVSQ